MKQPNETLITAYPCPGMNGGKGWTARVAAFSGLVASTRPVVLEASPG